MSSPRPVAAIRWVLSFAALALIITADRYWLHANPTTVALTLVLYILFLASQCELRYSITIAVFATAAYNFYFLPPVGTFAIADPQNWVALLTFLATSVIGSRLSQRARDEALAARKQQRELQVLYTLSRELLQTESLATAAGATPAIIRSVTGAQSVVLYIAEGDNVYFSSMDATPAFDLERLRDLAIASPVALTCTANEAFIQLRAGVDPRGLLAVSGAVLSPETLDAIGGLVSIALDRAQAIETAARSEANRESERLRTLMLDSITHELRTPLTSIKAAAGSMLASPAMSPHDIRELLSVVDEEADRLNRLITQAVEMAQIEARQVQMHFRAVALADVVATARDACSWIASTHPVSVELPRLPRVSADTEMIGKVLCNLLENAAKYSAPGSAIVISAELRAGFIHTSVTDHGVGIAPSEQPLIFGRLYRSPSQAEGQPGTGMGLAISRAIVEAHHGTLRVSSRPGTGSVFTFTLPVARGL